jgi:hypothetical protein
MSDKEKLMDPDVVNDEALEALTGNKGSEEEDDD